MLYSRDCNSNKLINLHFTNKLNNLLKGPEVDFPRINLLLLKFLSASFRVVDFDGLVKLTQVEHSSCSMQ